MKRVCIFFSGVVLIAITVSICGCDGGMLHPLIAVDSDTGPSSGGDDSTPPTETEESPDSQTSPEPADTGSDPSPHDSETIEACVDPFGCFDDADCHAYAAPIGNGVCSDAGKTCCAMPEYCFGDCIQLHTDQCAGGLIDSRMYCAEGSACCQLINPDYPIPECPGRMNPDFDCNYSFESCMSAAATPTGFWCPEPGQVCCYLR